MGGARIAEGETGFNTLSSQQLCLPRFHNIFFSKFHNTFDIFSESLIDDISKVIF